MNGQDDFNSGEEGEFCWLCHYSDGTHWRSPCRCRGSLGYIHEECLNEYVRQRQGGDPHCPVRCSVCQYRYNITLVLPQLTTAQKALKRIDGFKQWLSPLLIPIGEALTAMWMLLMFLLMVAGDMDIVYRAVFLDAYLMGLVLCFGIFPSAFAFANILHGHPRNAFVPLFMQNIRHFNVVPIVVIAVVDVTMTILTNPVLQFMAIAMFFVVFPILECVLESYLKSARPQWLPQPHVIDP